MPLIKSTNAPAGMQPYSMRDIENQAKAILLRARERAEQFLAAAQGEAEKLKMEARAEGLTQGRAEGTAKGREEGLAAGREQALAEQRVALTAAMAALNKATTTLDASRRELESTALRDVIQLAIAIAERVTKRHGVLDPQVALANVEEALKLVSHASDIRIAIHPSQKAALDEFLPKLKMQWPKLAHVQLLEDGELAPGGCRVFTANGQVDGDLDEQLRRVVADLLPAQSGELA